MMESQYSSTSLLSESRYSTTSVSKSRKQSIKFKIPKSIPDVSIRSSQITLKFDNREYFAHREIMNKVSRTIEELPPNETLYDVKTKSNPEFFIKFVKVIDGQGKMEVPVSVNEFKWLRCLLLEFQINGDVLYKDKTIYSLLENELTAALKPEYWREMLEFASHLKFKELRKACFIILHSFNFDQLRKISTPLDVTSEDFDELLSFYFDKAHSYPSAVLTPEEFRNLIEVQFANIEDDERRLSIKKMHFERYLRHFGKDDDNIKILYLEMIRKETRKKIASMKNSSLLLKLH